MIHEPLVAHGVTRISCVLTAVDLNDKTPFAANKIYDVRADLLLSDELESE